jgi:integrase
MQRGSLIQKERKQGPAVWQFRWSDKGPDGRRIYRKRVIGTVEEYVSAEVARHAVKGLLAKPRSTQPDRWWFIAELARNPSCRAVLNL